MRRSFLLTAALLCTAPALAAPPGPVAPPRSMVPAPLPPGEEADIPGGSSRNGVIRPPRTGDRAIRHTPPRSGAMMVIPPSPPHDRERDGGSLSPR